MPEEWSPIVSGLINVLYLAGSCAAIAAAVRKWWLGQPLVPFTPREEFDMGGVFTWLRRAVARTRGEIAELPPAADHVFWSDVRLGVAGFFVSFLPVILIHLYCRMFVPYEHHAIEAILADRSTHVFLAWAFATVVPTPIMEEFIFRNLVQGMLEVYERMLVRHSKRWIFGVVPIALSSLAFALMHWDQGAAAIPLFVFSLVLGYLYYQTHRLTAPIVAHAMLNLVTMINLWFLR